MKTPEDFIAKLQELSGECDARYQDVNLTDGVRSYFQGMASGLDRARIIFEDYIRWNREELEK